MFNSENDNGDYNESAFFAKILYNSIEVVKFNNEYKIINIYKTNYNNINNNKNLRLYDNLKLKEFFENNINSELVLYERNINQQKIYIYIYPTKEKIIPGYFKSIEESVILSYPIIIYIKSDDTLDKLQLLIFQKLKNLLIKNSKEVSDNLNIIEICMPHFSNNYIFNKNNECSICKQKYTKYFDHCKLFDTLDKNLKIESLIKLVPNNQLILYAKSNQYDLTKCIYSGVELFKDNFINENISKKMNIYDCLNLFKKDIILDNWYCKKCNKNQNATKNLEIYKTPLYLIISLKDLKNKM